MRLSKFVFALFALMALALAAACSSPTPTPTATPSPTSTATPIPIETQALVAGWYQDKGVKYYDFGTKSPASNGTVSIAPIFVFITGMDSAGNPQFVEGQHNIVDTVPGVEGYSDLWRVMLVTVPESYQPDSVRSRQELDAAGYSITSTDILVNCPIVPEGTMLEGGEALTQGRSEGDEVYYPDFGMNTESAVPIWAFITGMDAAGNPQFVEGQRNVIDVVPGDIGYSAFWEVNLVIVPEGYQANAIRSAADVRASGYEIIKPGLVVNCPVTVVDQS
ncbi:MAG: hypothetical protein O2812_02530 [Chloroflexi bacterium]|nr:hypothetical protein [Chloroflexota bacterium]